MGDCGKILSLFRSFSETDIGCRSTILNTNSRGQSSETLPIAKFIDQKKILNSILNSSSSSSSSQVSLQEFQDFAFDSGTFQIQKKKALFGRRKRKLKRVKNKKKQKRVQFRDCVVAKIEKSPSSTIVMHCRHYARPTGGPRYYVQDGYRARIQKKDHRPQCSNFSCNYVDPTPKYLQKTSRSISPHLPKLSYLEKNHCQQYQPSPNYYCQQPLSRQRLVFKSQPYQPSSIQDVSQSSSKKSIPQHALMRNLLSGLSIFDDEERSRGLSQRDSSIHRYKSMGNINNYCKNNLELKPSIKSSLDFSDVRNYNDEDFREYCRNYAKESVSKLQTNDEAYYVPENYFAPKSCTDRNCPFNCERNMGDGCFFKQSYASKAHMEDDRVSPTRRNIVQERKQFFENKEKGIKEDCRNGRSKSPKVFHLQAEKENPEEYESVTELYRNAHTISSSTSISRSKHSRCASKPIELFHPDYNFDQSSTDMRQSIIESIRTKIFRVPQTSFSEEDEYVLDTPRCPKFPKETRKAVSMIINQKKHQCKCSRNRQLNSVETQTSPVSSKPSLVHDGGMPCTKNLLCGKGYHSGRCGDEVSRRMERICREDCFCRRDQYALDGLRAVLWPGRAKRDCTPEREHARQVDRREEKIDFDGYLEEESCNDGGEETGEYRAVGEYSFGIPEDGESFLQYIRPDRESSSEESERYAERVSYEVIPLSSSSTDMNGLNGHANGDLNGCGDIITQNQQRGCWTIGLINSKYRYLTAETFGFKINANGTSLKKKQIWTLEPDTTSGSESFIYLKSHLDKYLAVDSFGNVTCESEEKEPGSKFHISVSEDGKGRWAFRNVVRGYFLGSSSDKLTCTAKVPGDAEFWYIHLAARPQVNLRSVGRKRFAHLSENLDEIHVDANIPWGEDTLFTLEFHADEDGKYALHTCNNKYLSAGGKLIDTCNKDCLFSAEYHSGQLALRDRSGQYLSPIGSKAVLKTRSNTVTKDELFSLEDSLPQASFVAALNARYVSVKQGVDVTANQDEISDHETFQLEFDWTTKRWYIRTMQDRYWTLETGGGIQASGDKRSSNALFDLVWQNDGSLAFRANNGRYVITKRSGHLYATSDVIDDNCKYYFYLINRPILVLKCEQGFVGYKSSSSPKLECNKASYECIQVERAEKGVIYFKGQTGKYWHVDSEGVTADSDAPEGFYLELREPTRLCIKNSNGNYITASKNGIFRLGDTSIEHATQWEY